MRNKIKENKEIIEENLKRIEEGQPLTVPLALLNGDFKKEYIRRTGANLGEFSKILGVRQRGIIRVGKGIYYEKKCVFCDKKFETNNKRKKFCSVKCGNQWLEELKSIKLKRK